MRAIPISKFRARCLEIIRDVERNGESVLITKRGRPMAVLGPAHAESRKGWVLGQFRCSAKIVGDLVEPFDEPWEALIDPSSIANPSC